MVRRLAALVLVLLLATSVSARAHEDGEAIPDVTVTLEPGEGLSRTVSVEVVDLDSREPITGATVDGVATMRKPHVMTTHFGPLPERRPGAYAGTIRFPMPAEWTVEIAVRGERIRTSTATAEATIERSRAAAEPAPSPLAVTVAAEQALTSRDVTSIAVLWLHALSALGWILGVVLMVAALGPWQVITPAARRAARRAYLPWGALAHWALAAVVVGTGIYNLRSVTPFALVWRPGELDRLRAIPFGELYEAVLLVKLVLFAFVLVAGSVLLARALRSRPPGPLFIAYLLAVPVLLAAAASLRYVHVLSHVADVAGAR